MSTDSDNQSAEDRLIARYFKPVATHPGALGLTDDAAFLTPPPDYQTSSLTARSELASIRGGSST